MAKAFRIDSDIPIPKPIETPSVPLEDLQVGESILFDLELRSKVQMSATRLKQATSKEFTVRKVSEKDARIWRTK